MNMNPLQLIGMLKNANNPQQLMMDLMQNNCNNPMMKNAMGSLLSMVQQNDTVGVERMARNLAKERGINPDEMMKNIRSQLGM